MLDSGAAVIDCERCQPAISDAGELVRALRLAGHLVTPAREAVLQAAVAQGRPFSAAQLCATLAETAPTIGRATVFRTLELLASERVVDRLHSLTGEPRYVLRDPAFPNRPRHYLVCSTCDRVTELDDPDLAALLGAIAARESFQPEAELVEIVGRCRSC